VKEVRAPVLIVHCNQDPVIPFQFGRDVYDAALVPKTFLEVKGYCHEEASLVAPSEYRIALQEFLNTL
jgi:hypothetical protein